MGSWPSSAATDRLVWPAASRSPIRISSSSDRYLAEITRGSSWVDHLPAVRHAFHVVMPMGIADNPDPGPHWCNGATQTWHRSATPEVFTIRLDLRRSRAADQRPCRLLAIDGLGPHPDRGPDVELSEPSAATTNLGSSILTRRDKTGTGTPGSSTSTSSTRSRPGSSTAGSG